MQRKECVTIHMECSGPIVASGRHPELAMSECRTRGCCCETRGGACQFRPAVVQRAAHQPRTQRSLKRPFVLVS